MEPKHDDIRHMSAFFHHFNTKFAIKFVEVQYSHEGELKGKDEAGSEYVLRINEDGTFKGTKNEHLHYHGTANFDLKDVTCCKIHQLSHLEGHWGQGEDEAVGKFCLHIAKKAGDLPEFDPHDTEECNHKEGYG